MAGAIRDRKVRPLGTLRARERASVDVCATLTVLQ